MLNILKKEGQDFVHNFQKIMIMKEVQKTFGEMYLGGGENSTDIFFIMANTTTNCQMDASEFKELLYNMLSEEPFLNHILGMTDENEEYTISDYVSEISFITIGETWTCITCRDTKSPKILKDFAFIFPLEDMTKKDKKGGK